MYFCTVFGTGSGGGGGTVTTGGNNNKPKPGGKKRSDTPILCNRHDGRVFLALGGCRLNLVLFCSTNVNIAVV